MKQKSVAIASLIGFSLLLAIKRDGYVPFKSQSPAFLIDLGNLVILLLITLLIFAPFINWRFKASAKLKAFLSKYQSALLSLLIVMLNLLTAGLLFKNFLQTNIINAQIIWIFVVCLMVGVLPILFIYRNRANYSLISLFISCATWQILSIFLFPDTWKLSDLLPIVQRQVQAFLAGQNIYQYYLLETGVLTQAVRQPGIMLLYLPAVILKIDLRFMSLIYNLLSAVVLIRFIYPQLTNLKFDSKFIFTFCFLLFALIMPYSIMRSDLYDPPFWFLLTLAFYLLYKQKLKFFSLIWGMAIFTQIWSWIITPFIGLYIFRNYGWKASLQTALIYLSIGLGVLALFILPNPQAYFEHVFGYYNQAIAAHDFAKVTPYLTPWIFQLGWQDCLKAIQFAACALVGMFALKKLRTYEDLLFFSTLIVFVFIQFNIISWIYMYLVCWVLLIIYLLITSSQTVNTNQ